MSRSERIQIGLVQMRCAASPRDNLSRAMELIRQAARQGTHVICLPELFLSRYFCQTEDHRHFDLAEPIPGDTTHQLGSLARELQVVLIASLFEKRAPGIYHNTAVVLDADGALLGKYRKMHIPDDPSYFEKFYFTPGDLGFRVFPTRYATLGVLICWDQWFPEAARLIAMQGADILFYPTAIGWHPSERAECGPTQRENWELMHRAHAIANGLFVAAVNRAGLEGDSRGGIEFWGQSFACDPQGIVLERASVGDEQLLVAEVRTEQIDLARTHWPFFRDRRIDAYEGLTHRYLDLPRD